MIVVDQPADTAERAGWLLWGTRWFWLVVAGLAAAGLGREAQAAVAGYAIVNLVITFDLLRREGPSRGLTWIGVGADVVAPAVILAAAGGPLGPVWSISLAGAGSLAIVGGTWLGWAGSWFGLVLAGVLLGAGSGGVVVGLLLAGLHAVVLIPAGLAAAWGSARAQHSLDRSDDAAVRVEGSAGVDRRSLPIDGVLSPDQLLEHLLPLAAEALSTTGLARASLSGAALRGHPGEWTAIAGALQGRSTAADGGVLAEAVASGRPEISWDPAGDPAFRVWATEQGWASAICLPLVGESGCVGAIVVGHPQGDAFGRAQLEALAALGQEARIVLPYADRYQELTRERDQLIELQEEARKKLARNLHDGPTQVIAAIAMRTNFARRQLSIDARAADEELGKVEEMARETTREIRHMLFTLRPLILESQGLVAALRQYARKVRDTHNLVVEIEADEAIESELGPEEQGSLFYIAEEAVNNAQKHAAAAVVWVRLQRVGNDVVLEVEDNGVGFNVGEVDRTYEQRGSLGMVTMRERTQLLGGTFEVRSQEGVGTTIRVAVPVR